MSHAVLSESTVPETARSNAARSTATRPDARRADAAPADAAPATPTFASLGVPAPLVAVLTADGKTAPFPIQADTLADTLAGRDVLGRGRTGSGKTLAFCLPLAARLGGGIAEQNSPAQSGKQSAARSGDRRHSGRPRGLILAPTRELASQIETVLKPLAGAYGLVTTTIFGGVKQTRQVEALRRGVDIVVACPGRLEDLMQQGFVTLDGVQITVLDEADHMADLGFLPVVTRILTKTPAVGQRMLFSATLDNGVDKIVRRFLSDPVLHSVDSESSPVAAMTHHVFSVAGTDVKNDVVTALASGTGKRILFMRTKHQAKKLAKKLTAAGIPAVDLHGNLSQSRRDRNLAEFSGGTVKVLVATDVAARGVDIDDVELVVHVDPPAEHKAYLHRSGRTARAGSSGTVVTICLPEQRGDLSTLLKKAKIQVKPTGVTASSAVVADLVGEVAPYVKPEPQPVNTGARQGGSGGGTRRGGSGRSGGQGGGSRSGGQGGGGRRGGPGAGSSRGASGARNAGPRHDSRGGPRGGSGAGARTNAPAGGGSRRARGAGRAGGRRG